MSFRTWLIKILGGETQTPVSPGKEPVITIGMEHYRQLIRTHIEQINFEQEQNSLVKSLAGTVIPAYVELYFGEECDEYDAGCAICKAHQARRFLLDYWCEEFRKEIEAKEEAAQ